jgi:hypothetical protein
MKKKILALAITSALAIAATIEVFAEGAPVPTPAGDKEAGGNECYNTITTDPLHQVMYCGTCSMIPGNNVWYSSKGSC